MYYGIDLGTTYSLIGSGDKLLSGLVPSVVNADTREVVSRRSSGNNIVRNYKVNITTGNSGAIARNASTIVLKELKKEVEQATGQEVKDVIITVPAKFTHTQREATVAAGVKAGFNVHAILNEPTAAAIYVCDNKPGLYLVFDLGGGTFDVTLIYVDCDNYTVIATDGIANLGGNDFDKQILYDIYKEKHILIKDRTPQAVADLLVDIQQAKEQFQTITTNDPSVSIDLSAFDKDAYTLTKEKYLKAMQVFNPAIVLSKTVMAETMDIETPTLIFVGGSTMCPYLREYVTQKLGLPVFEGVTVPNDTLVARGVAKYAAEYEKGKRLIQDVTDQISVKAATGLAIPIISRDAPLPAEGKACVTNSEESDELILDLYQGSAMVEENNAYIGTMHFSYGERMPAQSGVVILTVNVDYNGIITLSGLNVCNNQSQSIVFKLEESIYEKTEKPRL